MAERHRKADTSARAVRRCGELLKQWQGQGTRTDKEKDLVGAPPLGRNETLPKENGAGTDTISQRKAAADVGMSKRQGWATKT